MAGLPWQDRLQALWWSSQATPPWPLRCLARWFGRGVHRRREAYLSGRRAIGHLPVPVIVVGNRIVGGAGKTPTTLALLEALRAAGWRPGVVSRGHGRQRHDVSPVRADSASADAGDEPLLMARRSGVPVWVGRDRTAAAQALLAAHPTVNLIVCDDGLQHLALGRDLEIIVFDERGTGNGHLLPAGPLREPIDAPSTARHQWVLYNAAAPSTPLPGALARRTLAPPCPLAIWHADGPPPNASDRTGWQTWQDRPVWALAGIGSPQRFFSDLRKAGVRLPAEQALPMPDHADYQHLPWPDGPLDLLVTEKDAVKFDPARLARERPATRVWVVPLRYKLPGSLVEEVTAALRQRPTAAR